MSFEIREIPGAVVTKIEPCDHFQKNRTLKLSSLDECFNAGIDEQASVKLKFNVYMLAEIISKKLNCACVYGYYTKDCDCDFCTRCRALADDINAAGSKIIEVDK